MSSISKPIKSFLVYFCVCWMCFACNSDPVTQAERSIDKVQEIPIDVCENCEQIHAYGNKLLKPIDTIPTYQTSLEKLKLTGTIYQKDATTPAKDVILYIYQTNADGIYEKITDDKGQSHFQHRAWIKTDESGQYTFYTFIPGAYPGETEAQHIHALIKEKNKAVYYIDNFFFDQDSLLTKEKRNNLKNRGGTGILNLQKEGDLWLGKRDIILGLHIPNYQ